MSMSISESIREDDKIIRVRSVDYQQVDEGG